MRRILVVGDTHCGSTHGFSMSPVNENQQALKDWFEEEVKPYRGRIDTVVGMGDFIDGDGGKSRGVEQTTTDRHKQADDAVDFLEYLKPRKNYLLVRGTPYHTGQGECFDALVATRLRDKGYTVVDDDVLNVSIEGTILNIKHKVGRSNTLNGSIGPITKSTVNWSQLFSEAHGFKADIVLRGHVHDFQHVDNGTAMGFIVPALQLPGTRYGSRECEGRYAVGFLYFEIDGETVTWRKHLARLQQARPRLQEA